MLGKEVPRAPRIGVEPDRLAQHGIDFEASECHLVAAGVQVDAKLASITNIAVGGLKVVLANVATPPQKDSTIIMQIAGRDRSWKIKGRLAWVSPLAGDQWWAGVEFSFSVDASDFYKALAE